MTSSYRNFLVVILKCVIFCHFFKYLFCNNYWNALRTFFSDPRSIICVGDQYMKGLSTDTNQRKEEGIDQKSMQSDNTPIPGHHMGKCQNTRKHPIQESQEVSSFPTVTTRLHET